MFFSRLLRQTNRYRASWSLPDRFDFRNFTSKPHSYITHTLSIPLKSHSNGINSTSRVINTVSNRLGCSEADFRVKFCSKQSDLLAIRDLCFNGFRRSRSVGVKSFGTWRCCFASSYDWCVWRGEKHYHNTVVPSSSACQLLRRKQPKGVSGSFKLSSNTGALWYGRGHGRWWRGRGRGRLYPFSSECKGRDINDLK